MKILINQNWLFLSWKSLWTQIESTRIPLNHPVVKFQIIWSIFYRSRDLTSQPGPDRERSLRRGFWTEGLWTLSRKVLIFYKEQNISLWSGESAAYVYIKWYVVLLKFIQAHDQNFYKCHHSTTSNPSVSFRIGYRGKT